MLTNNKIASKLAFKCQNGETLTEDQLTELYCEFPDVYDRGTIAENALVAIAHGTVPESKAQHFACRVMGINPEPRVKIPESEEEAKCMLLVAEQYLKGG